MKRPYRKRRSTCFACFADRSIRRAASDKVLALGGIYFADESSLTTMPASFRN
jgi:hypothetical protein